MGIYIKGMEMPKDGELLCINIHPDGKVSINLDLQCKQIATAIDVLPHGRLIDADEFMRRNRVLYCGDCERRKGLKNGKLRFVYKVGDAPCRACYCDDMLSDIDDTPIIIPADPADKEV